MTTTHGEYDALYKELLKCLKSKRGYRQWLFDRKKNERYVKTIKEDVEKIIHNDSPIASGFIQKRLPLKVPTMGLKKKECLTKFTFDLNKKIEDNKKAALQKHKMIEKKFIQWKAFTKTDDFLIDDWEDEIEPNIALLYQMYPQSQFKQDIDKRKQALMKSLQSKYDRSIFSSSTALHKSAPYGW